jgi:hypothetical protein
MLVSDDSGTLVYMVHAGRGVDTDNTAASSSRCSQLVYSFSHAARVGSSTG